MLYSRILATTLLLMLARFGLATDSIDDEDSVTCPDGYVLITVTSLDTKNYCVAQTDWPFTILPIPLPIEIEGPVAPTVYYYAGTCERPLGGLPAEFGPVRHDDVELYTYENFTKTDQLQKGFYAQSMAEAIASATQWLLFRHFQYVRGIHDDDTTTTCTTLPRVSKSRYETIKTRALTEEWTLYHLFFRNCQHWANHVTR